MLNIVIPMAGRGSRFQNAGFKAPKPLIVVDGKPMIQRVIQNLRPSCDHRFTFICRSEDLEKYHIEGLLRSWTEVETTIVTVDQVTEGAACTVLVAEPTFRPGEDLLIANSDQLIDVSISEFLKFSNSPDTDGVIMTFEATDSKWSFARVNNKGLITEVAEKKPISNIATVGIYYFKSCMEFVDAAKKMIEKDLRVNNEFYVCPVYNELIETGKSIRPWNIQEQSMHGLGTPEDLKIFEDKISQGLTPQWM